MASSRRLAEIYSTMGGNSQVDARLSFDWENLYLIDISLFPHKVGVLVEYQEISEMIEDFDPRLQLKLRLLKENGWDIFTVKYSDFKKNPSQVAKHIVDTLKEVNTFEAETKASNQGAGNKG